LLFQEGIWLYNDLGWWPKNSGESYNALLQARYSWDNNSSSAYGFDRYFISFQKIITTPYIFLLNSLFPNWLAQILFYFIPSVVGFFFGTKLLRSLNSKSPELGMIFYNFNPVSLYLIAQGTVYLSFQAIPVFLYSFYKILNNNFSAKYLLINIISLAIISSYLRVLGVLLVFILFASIFFFRVLFSNLIEIGLKKIASVAVLYLIVFSGFISSFVFILIDNSGSQANYVSYQANLYADSFYDSTRLRSWISIMSLSEITSNFSQNYNGVFAVASLALYLFVIGLSLSVIKKSQISLFALAGFTATLFLMASAKFLNKEAFLLLFLKILPFLAMNVLWLKVALVLFIVALISQINNSKKILFSLVIIYCGLSIFPIINWADNIKLHKIKEFDSFYKLAEHENSSVFFPVVSNIYDSIHQNIYPYPLNPTFHQSLHSLLSRNFRLVSNFQVDLALQMDTSIDNYYLLGLKQIFVFKEIADFVEGKFDWYQKRDYSMLSQEYKSKLQDLKKYSLVENNYGYERYNYVDSSNFNYKLYSPSSILFSELNNFSQLEMSSKERLVLLDPRNVDFPLEIIPHLRSSKNDLIKLSFVEFNRPDLFYVKISNYKYDRNLLIQLNQSFHPRWKIFEISKEDWENTSCKDFIEFPITNNEVCFGADSPSSSFLPLNHKKISNEHLPGNFIGNLFVINKDQFTKLSDTDEIYLAIYFEKQMYYIIFQLVFWGILMVLFLMSLWKKVSKKK
jgi:hypothetical protein